MIDRIRHLFWKPKVGDRVIAKPYPDDGWIPATIIARQKVPKTPMYNSGLEVLKSYYQYTVELDTGARLSGLRQRELRRV